VVLALASGAGPFAATVGYFAAVGLSNAVSFAWAMRQRANRSVDPEAVPYGKRLTLISALGALQSYADKVVVGAFLSVEALAMYSAGKMFQQVLTMTWSAMNQMYFPKLASRKVEESRRLTRATLPLVWGGFAALGLAVIAVTPWVIRTIFGARYVPAIPLAQIFTLGVVFAIPGAQFEVLFTATADERRLYVQRVTFAVVQLVLVAAGAYFDGARGAAIGVVLTYAANSLNGWLLDRRRA
jgi:O-antigen/teichoic acid export membrane protein